ncbi:hydroxymethylglutaryl-CoA reductase [Mycobacterium ulcerans]|uniref:hydroxymethylglutaryl-CoA reductase n=1 Tax=Mycobacterium ulcerans TaxID=1809 RepID=UPI0012DE74E6|nr:hydroxymethylglutaryl-CoA reductase [Mycobacterium ulcerans]MEB3979464.1 hydroxymethylglutaryl-CoA reductase [Mycobacterium ulcerans]MEB4418309.1 hydroxymethylglutaryl-CoA reductase [Mycobacterium ulcerans]MEB4436460.1 hydroxymethylglutaryl-CoA reductase [Mycobacterium ulcerans]
MTTQQEQLSVHVPLRWVGPIKISGGEGQFSAHAPLATYESPVWPSVGRGAKLSRLTENGIVTTLIDEKMTRSILLIAPDAAVANNTARQLQTEFAELAAVVGQTSRFAELIGMHPQITANLLFIRFEFRTGDASGHNMATLAADHLIAHILTHYPQMEYGSISGNMCCDKKPIAINGILGRGKNVVTEIVIPRDLVEQHLHTSAAAITALNIRKNLIGTLQAGTIRSANAHYANMLLAFYLATGQDAANIIAGSQGVTHAEDRDGDLYFSCTIPNLIVGTVGNGKDLDFVTDNLAQLGCREQRPPGANARRLAVICAATVLCGELSLMAAQTNPGELMRAHTTYERKPSTA